MPNHRRPEDLDFMGGFAVLCIAASLLTMDRGSWLHWIAVAVAVAMTHLVLVTIRKWD